MGEDRTERRGKDKATGRTKGKVRKEERNVGTEDLLLLDLRRV